MWPWIYWKSATPLTGRLREILESTSQEKFKNRVASSWGLGRDVAGSHLEKEAQSRFPVISKWPSKSQRKRKYLAAKPSPLFLSRLWALVQPHALPKPPNGVHSGGQSTQGITSSLKQGIIYVPLPMTTLCYSPLFLHLLHWPPSTCPYWVWLVKWTECSATWPEGLGSSLHVPTKKTSEDSSGVGQLRHEALGTSFAGGPFQERRGEKKVAPEATASVLLPLGWEVLSNSKR